MSSQNRHVSLQCFMLVFPTLQIPNGCLSISEILLIMNSDHTVRIHKNILKWSIIEKQGHVIRRNKLTLIKTNDPLDVRCVLFYGSNNGVLYLPVFRLNQKNRKLIIHVSIREGSKRENALQNSMHVYRFSTPGSTGLLTAASCWRPRRREQIAITRTQWFYRYCMEFETNT
jgi:hypothetical protein